MRYQRCVHFDEGYCYNQGLRNGLNSLGCVGYDRCDHYETDPPVNKEHSRMDVVGSNGNDGQHYLVERICRIIAGDSADQVLGGHNKGKRRWENHIKQALEIMEVFEDE